VDLDQIFFIRTASGEASHADPAATMSPAFRRMLHALDGSRSLADLAPLFPHLDAEDMRMWIGELLRQKMIKRAPSLTNSQRLRMRQNTPDEELQVQKIAEQIRPWLAGKSTRSTAQHPVLPAQLTRTARLAAIEAGTAAELIGREGFFLNPAQPQKRLAAGAQALVLVVEDDDIQARIVGKYLEKDGHRVRLAFSGAQALAALGEQPLPDLLLLDVALPDADGFGILEQVRAQLDTRHLRVIMLTGHTDAAHIAKGVLLGADGYITKPFLPEMLKLAVRRLLPAS